MSTAPPPITTTSKATIPVSEILENLPDVSSPPRETQVFPVPCEPSGSRLADTIPPSPSAPSIVVQYEPESVDAASSSTVSSSAEGNFWFTTKDKGKEKEKENQKGKDKENKDEVKMPKKHLTMK